jgi:hypothetical protein
MERAQTPPPDPADDALVADLRRVLALVDPVPEHVRLAARWAIEWRTLDAELAELVHDSLVDEPVLAVRGAPGPRALTFETPGLTIEVEAESQSATEGDTVRLAGQLIPAQAAQIVIYNGDEMQVTSADERGRFVAAGLSRGPLGLRCRLRDTRLVETSLLTI